jgi:hypothetical protein
LQYVFQYGDMHVQITGFAKGFGEGADLGLPQSAFLFGQAGGKNFKDTAETAGGNPHAVYIFNVLRLAHAFPFVLDALQMA